eukprot:Seg3094.1 transcript_id=Seg3094.1/GoldUCD/mRNA.D3Y31 product="ATP-dependent DNA helicase RecQ" protein_id=Seg3094.1/GoldUCD/D3Y31
MSFQKPLLGSGRFSCFQRRNKLTSLQDKHKIEWTDIKLKKIAGEGSFATVHAAEWKGQEVAVKCYKLNNVIAAYRGNLIKEAEFMLSLSHPNIVKCFGACAEQMGLVMELMSKVVNVDGNIATYHTLREVLDDLQDAIPFDLRIEAISQIKDGILFLHARNIIHCDLKSANILTSGIEDEWKFKLTDFGESHVTMTATASSVLGTASRDVKGTAAFIPPEYFNCSETKMQKFRDVYSFGMVMFEVLTPALRHPWEQEVPRGEMAIIANMVQKGNRPSIPHEENMNPYASSYVELMKLCWAQNPFERPAIKEISSNCEMLKNAMAAATAPEIEQANESPSSFRLTSQALSPGSSPFKHAQLGQKKQQPTGVKKSLNFVDCPSFTGDGDDFFEIDISQENISDELLSGTSTEMQNPDNVEDKITSAKDDAEGSRTIHAPAPVLTIEGTSVYEGLDRLPTINHDTRIKWNGYLSTYFNFKGLRKFQEHAINALEHGIDVAVVQSTSSGKSLVYQLPAVMASGKISVCLCPTVSLMSDQVASLRRKGIPVIKLGSDHTLQDYNAVFNSDGEELPKIVFMTPEYLFGASTGSTGCVEKLKALEHDGKLAYIAIDEAHYIWQWGGGFRRNYAQLKTIKDHFPRTPIAALTATATPNVLKELRNDILRSPVIVRGCVNRPNVYVSAFKSKCFGESSKNGKKTVPYVENDRYKPVAMKVKELIKEESAIIYTSFAEDCRRLASVLKDIGIDAEFYVGSSGSMTSKMKEKVVDDFRAKKVQVICGTEAFGVGVDIPHVRYVIRIGCPPSIQLWIQELGRAGRDGSHAEAVLLYNEYADIQRLPFWTKGDSEEEVRRKHEEYKASWVYIYNIFIGKCLRKAVRDFFNDPVNNTEAAGRCCMPCENPLPTHNAAKYVCVLLGAIAELQGTNGIGEKKVCEWVRGNNVKWKKTPELKKKIECSAVEGKGKNMDGKDISADWWQVLIRQMIALGFVKIMFHTNRFQRYEQTNRTLLVSKKGEAFLKNPSELQIVEPSPLEVSLHAKEENKGKAQQQGQKSIRRQSTMHYLPRLEQLMEKSESWSVCTGDEYVYLGFDHNPDALLYLKDHTKAPNAARNDPHFVYNDLQLSKGPSNKPMAKEWNVDGSKLKVIVQKSPCEGVKQCGSPECTYVVSKRQQINRCKAHADAPLVPSGQCPVKFVYIYPENFTHDTRRWLGVISAQTGKAEHNHSKPAACKLPAILNEEITKCVKSDCTKTAKEVQLGYGMPCMPAEISPVASNIDVIHRVIKKARVDPSVTKHYAIIHNFEHIIRSRVDNDGNSAEKGSPTQRGFNEEVQAYLTPYKIGHQLTDTFNLVYFVSRLMAKVITSADFIVANVTFPNVKEFPYLLNVVAFNYLTMEYMVCARVNMDRVSAKVYQMAFMEIFSCLNRYYPEFEEKSWAPAIAVDYSEAQIKGITNAVGKEKAFAILKGCKVHWMRSVLRIGSRVCKSEDELEVFKVIGKEIPEIEEAEVILKLFDILCGKVPLTELAEHVDCSAMPCLTTIDTTSWKGAESWSDWWVQQRHLKLLCGSLSDMDEEKWQLTPDTSNAVESHNRLCVPVAGRHLTLLSQLEHQYRIDKLATQKHVAAENDVKISNKAQTCESLARRTLAKARWRNKRSKSSSAGENLERPATKRKKMDTTQKVVGKLVSVECADDNGKTLGWFPGRVESYETTKGYLIRFTDNLDEYIFAQKVPTEDIRFL